MENKVNFIPAMNFINLLHTRRGEENEKNKAESIEKWDCDSFR